MVSSENETSSVSSVCVAAPFLGGCVTTATYTPEPIKVTRGTLLFGRDIIEALSRAILNSKTAADGSRQVQNRLEFSEIILTWVNYKIYY